MSKTENKNKYDLTVMLPDEDVSFVESILKDQGVDDIKSDVTKVNFAYEIDGNTQGYMAVFNFSMNSDSVDLLNKKFKADNNVLRHLLLRDTLKEKNDVSKSKKPSSKPKSKPKEGKDDEPLTNEAIEQKIEEITN